MLLAINTCGSTATVALGAPDADRAKIRIVASATLAARTYSARLIPEIAAMLEGQKLAVRDLQAIVVVDGPGSFTGIRVGIGTAKGLAAPYAIPLIGVSRLALLAAVSRLPHVLAAIDAGRGEYYVGEFQNGKTLSEKLLTGEETIAAATRPGAPILVCDEGGPEEDSACAALSVCGPVYVQSPDASEALRFALPRFLAADFEDAESLEANYVRRPDAEVIREARLGIDGPISKSTGVGGIGDRRNDPQIG